MARSIKRDFQYLLTGSIVVTMLMLSSFWVYFDYRSLQEESERLRLTYHREYEDLLKREVNKVVSEINYELRHLEPGLRTRLHILTGQLAERTSMFDAALPELEQDARISLLKNALIFDTPHKAGPKEPPSTGCQHALKPFFISLTNSPHKPTKTTQSAGSTHDDTAQPQTDHWEQNGDHCTVLRNLSRTNPSGFYSYQTQTDGPPANPAAAVTAAKTVTGTQTIGATQQAGLACYQTLPDSGLIVGIRVNLTDATRIIQEKLCDRIERLRFGKDNSNYFFVTTWDGVSMTFPAKGKNMYDVRDPNGVYIVRELIARARQGGGFVRYVMPKLEGLAPAPKLSYSAPIPEWQWYVGAGIYVDELETRIALNEAIFKQKVYRHLKLIAVTLLVLLLLQLFATRAIGRTIWAQIEKFSTIFRIARTQPTSIDINSLEYQEFREIGLFADKMLAERDEHLRQIQLSRDEWVNTFNAIGDAIFLLDADGTVIEANAATASIQSETKEKFLGQHFSRICGTACPARFTLDDGRPHSAEITHIVHDKAFLVSSYPIFTSENKLVRAILVARDITEQRRLKEQLSHAQKMEAIGTLAGGIAHDFNNILGVIIGNGEMARMYPDIDQKNNCISQVLVAANRARELVKQILAFSRQGDNARVPLQPSTIIKETIKLLRASLPSTITISQQISDDCGILNADPSHLHQLVMNLCTNAFHSMEEHGGTLTIELFPVQLDETALIDQPEIKPGEFLQLRVRDEGKGVPPELIHRIFEPFFTTKRIGQGTGMGLAIVHGVVTSYAGFINCRNRPGGGAEFNIFLPISHGIAPLRNSDEQKIVGGNEKILFIDDEPMLVEMAKSMLQLLGYRVTAMTSSIDALATFNASPTDFDLLITDQTMPGMTGMELASAILKRRPNLPIILCSGYSSLVSSRQARAIGIREISLKPIALRELATKIRRILDQQL